MTLEQLVTLYFERTNAMDTLWSFYITVVLALLAFFGAYKGQMSFRKQVLLAAAMSLGFLGFAWQNLGALTETTITRVASRDLILVSAAGDPKAEGQIEKLRPGIDPTTVSSLRAVHLGSDALVVFWIWALALRKDHGRALNEV
jgi:hypothetical protein